MLMTNILEICGRGNATSFFIDSKYGLTFSLGVPCSQAGGAQANCARTREEIFQGFRRKGLNLEPCASICIISITVITSDRHCNPTFELLARRELEKLFSCAPFQANLPSPMH